MNENRTLKGILAQKSASSVETETVLLHTDVERAPERIPTFKDGAWVDFEQCRGRYRGHLTKIMHLYTPRKWAFMTRMSKSKRKQASIKNLPWSSRRVCT